MRVCEKIMVDTGCIWQVEGLIVPGKVVIPLIDRELLLLGCPTTAEMNPRLMRKSRSRRQGKFARQAVCIGWNKNKLCEVVQREFSF
jgi:hypothetical protein